MVGFKKLSRALQVLIGIEFMHIIRRRALASAADREIHAGQHLALESNHNKEEDLS